MKIHELSIAKLLQGYENKSFSVEEVVKYFLSRIEKHDDKLNAFLRLNSKAVEMAREVDRQIAEKGIDKPLLGVPIAVKDNFLTRDMETTAASRVLEGYVPHYESTVTSKLREAGAIIIGKTNMDAWAHGSSTETSDYGTTLNPWDTSRSPGGSSGGSAAAVAAGFVPVAIGSETAGSVRQPAAWCGVTGFKPTYGRVSRYGVIAMASSTDSPGVISRNTDDALRVIQVVAGKDANDATTADKQVPNYNELMNNDLTGMKIGIVKEYLLDEMDDRIKKQVRQAGEKFEELGAEVSEVSLIDPRYSIGVYTVVQRSEVSSNLARYDGVRYGNGRDKFGDEAKRRIMLGTYTLSWGYREAYYRKALKVRTKIVNDFKKAFSKYDLLIGPVSPTIALKVGASSDQPMFGEMQDILLEPSSIAGLTAISVPCGFVDKMPVGLQIMADQFNEGKVFRTASAYESVASYDQLANLENE